MEYGQRKSGTTTCRIANIRLAALLVVGTLLGFYSRPGAAEIIDVYSSYSAEYNDNVLLTPTAPTADLAHYVNVGAHYQQSGKQLEAAILADLRYRHYSNGTLKDEVLPSLDAKQTWYLSPGRFHWNIQDRLSQIAIDRLASPSPDNLETYNVFLVGPTFTSRLGPVDTLELEGRYGNTFYSQTFDDSDRYSGKARWVHKWSSTTELGTSLEAQKVHFVHGAFDNYDAFEGVFSIKTKRRHSTTTIDVGGTSLNRETQNDRQRPLGRLTYIYTPTPATRLALLAESKFTALAEEVLKLQLGDPTSIRTGNIYYGQSVSTTYQQIWAPTTLGLSFYVIDRDYIDATPDEYLYGGEIDVSYDFSARLKGSVFGGYLNTDYASVTVLPIVDTGFGFKTFYRLTNKWNWNTEIRWSKRDSVDPARRYDQFVAMFSIVYGKRPEPEPIK